jgi:hypothetical protein
MQHYGLPTRLLDWTETFAVALYFAITECKHEASIFFLDPYSLNKLTCGQDEILDLDADFKNDYYGYFIDDALKGEAFPGNVIAIYPPRRNSRILAQKGVFTLHNHEQPLDTMYAQCIRRFDLSAEALDEAKRFLELSGVNDYAIFPDLEGLSRHLKKRYATLIRG